MRLHDGNLNINLPSEIIELLNVESRRRGVSRSELVRQLLGYRPGYSLPTQAQFSAFVSQCLGQECNAPLSAAQEQDPGRKRRDRERAKNLRKLILFATTPR